MSSQGTIIKIEIYMNYIKRAFGFLMYHLIRPHRLGHGIHSPFLFDFVTKVVYDKTQGNAITDNIQNARKNALQNKETIIVEDFGAGSLRMIRSERKVADITRFSSTNYKYGRLLHNMINYFQPQIVIELGTSLGFGAMYMASGNKNCKVYTIEGSKALSQKAQDIFSGLGFTNIIARQGNFDDSLPVILKENGKFDFLFIDGNHRKEAMVRYFYLCLPYARSRSVIVFDDIRWSDEMFEAWLEICSNETIKLSLDLFNMGIVFFNNKIQKQYHKIYY
jgi:predicted O-methyltransferase YrrM